jgi:hypothetical protein
VPLQGTIESFGIAEIFQLVSQQGKTGVLEIHTGDGMAKLRFREGKLAEAWPDKRSPGEQIGEMLIRAGLISPMQLNQALDRQRESLRKVGDLLIQMGAVRAADFQAILALQHRETVYRLLRLKRGRFVFLPQSVELEEGVSALMDTGMLLMEGFRQIDEWPKLLEKIPSEKQIYTRVPDVLPSEDLSAEESRVLNFVDGTATVREIMDRSRLGRFCACEALAGLYDRGLITPSGAVRRLRTRSKPVRVTRSADLAVALVLTCLAVLLLALRIGVWSRLPGELGTALGQGQVEAKLVSHRAEDWQDRRSPIKPLPEVAR